MAADPCPVPEPETVTITRELAETILAALDNATCSPSWPARAAWASQRSAGESGLRAALAAST